MKPLKTNDPRVIEILKRNGMPETCTLASLIFEPRELVRLVFECVVGDASADDIELLIGSACEDDAPASA